MSQDRRQTRAPLKSRALTLKTAERESISKNQKIKMKEDRRESPQQNNRIKYNDIIPSVCFDDVKHSTGDMLNLHSISDFAMPHYTKLFSKIQIIESETQLEKKANLSPSPVPKIPKLPSIFKETDKAPLIPITTLVQLSNEDSKLRSFEEWKNLSKDPLIMKDREPKTVKARNHSFVKGYIISRLKKLPLKIKVEPINHSYFEIFVEFDKYPDRGTCKLHSTKSPIVIQDYYSQKITRDTSIRFTIYFYGNDQVSITPEFFIDPNRVFNQIDYKWTKPSNLLDYSDYLELKIHPPPRLKPKKGLSKSCDMSTTVSHYNNRSTKINPNETQNLFQRTFNESGITSILHLPSSKDIKTESRIEASDNLLRRDANHRPKLGESLCLDNYQTNDSFFESSLLRQTYFEDEISPERNLTNGSFFFKKRKERSKEVSEALRKRTEEANRKKESMAEISIINKKEKIKEKFERRMKSDQQFLQTIEYLINETSSRVWLTVFSFAQTFENLKVILYKKKARDRVINFLYYCVTFIGRLKYRHRQSKKNKDSVVMGTSGNAMRLLAVLNQHSTGKSSRDAIGTFFKQANKCISIREHIRIAFVRLLEVKSLFKAHISRKRELKEGFMADLNRYNTLLKLLNHNTGRLYVDMMDDYKESMFEIYFNFRLNELLKRRTSKIITMRTADQMNKITWSDDYKYRYSMEKLAHEEYYNDLLCQLPEYKLLEMVNERIKTKYSIYESIAASCIHQITNKKEQNQTVILPKKVIIKGNKPISEILRRRQGIIFEKTKLSSDASLTLGLQKTHYVCILLTMSDYFKIQHSKSKIVV